MNKLFYNFPVRKFFVNVFKRLCLSRRIKDKTAVFVSHPDFADNIYPIYIELQKRGYKCLWVLNYPYSRKIAKIHKIKYIMLKKSIRNMYILSGYKLFFYSHHLPYMYKKNNQVIYDCWHGSPFKYYHGVLMNNKKDGYYFVPSSKGSLDIYYSMYPNQIDKQKSFPFRHFRTDYFIKGFSDDENKKVIDFFDLDKYKKILLCCLTWIRDSKVNDAVNNLLGLNLSVNEFELLNRQLANLNYLLIVKPHPGQRILDNFNFSNIVFVSSHDMVKNELQLYSLIYNSDILFTDYSSILFDYCLLDKPVGHIIHDWEYFTNNSKERFIYDNPEKLMYGTKIYNFEELLSFIKNPKNNNDVLRNEINYKYNEDPLLKESSTIKFIKEVLNEKI